MNMDPHISRSDLVLEFLRQNEGEDCPENSQLGPSPLRVYIIPDATAG
jgi:hypothetical protein